MIGTRWSIVAAALAVLFAWPAAAAEQAGVTAAVRGQVYLIPVIDKAKHRAKSGEDVFLGDEVSSSEESGMQLMLLDETVFTIGPNTDMTIDEFVYDPATGAGRVTASLARGVLRFVTGKVARGDPKDMVVKLPVGTIGIRGTIGAVLYDGVNPALVLLLGPGPRNNADARHGRLVVNAAGRTVSLTRPGWGTSIAPGGPPADPYQFSPDQIASMVNHFTPRPTESGPADEAGGGTATEAGGQSTAGGRRTSGSSLRRADFGENFRRRGTDAATTTATSGILDGIATFDQLRTIETGIFQYAFTGTFTQTLQDGNPVNKVGAFNASFEIDFGGRTVGGGSSFIQVDTTDAGGNINASTSILRDSYAGDVGLAQGIFEVGQLTNSFFDGTSATANNSNGVIANTATINVVFDDKLTGVSNKGVGSATSSPLRVP